MKTVCLFLFLSLVSGHVVGQADQIDSLIDSLVREHGVKELRIDLQTIDFASDTTRLLELTRFDTRGNRIEAISPGSRGRINRHISRYDLLDRIVLYRKYDEKDTTQFFAETKWVYIDSNHYRQERYVDGMLKIRVNYSAKTAHDTLWLTEDEEYLEYGTMTRKVYRDRYIGDTLKISEYIGYDDSLNLSSVDTYFHLKRDVDTGYLILEGQYIVKSEEWDQLHQNQTFMRDYYAHPEKYLQMQLDGKFAMEPLDEPHTYQIYNYKNQLLQNDYGIYKTTFEYNNLGQLVKEVHWGTNEREEYSGIIETGTVQYEYNDRGFPTKMTEISMARATKRISYYTYSF